MSRIPIELKNEIKDNCDIVEVISRYVKLEKKGQINYMGICPFHADKNASMTVNVKKKTFMCWACPPEEKSFGNVFNFVAKKEGISYDEAVALLGEEQGYDIKVENDIPEKYSKDYQIYDLAVKFYQNNLYTKEGITAIEYLEKRQIDKETIKKFKIGLSLQRPSLTEYLINNEYDSYKLVSLGLTNENNKDKFINRIMFPLFNSKGRPVAFSGRIYNTKDSSKYVNSTETEIFKKGNVLYNYHNVKKAKTKTVVVMEGFMDVIRASTVGIDNCVALMGTKCSEEQVRLLKEIDNDVTVILCLDGDNAGINSIIAIISKLEEANINTKLVLLPESLDPDEYILKYGSESFKKQIENSINPIDFKMSLLKKQQNLSDGNDKSNYINSTIKELIKIDDSVVVEHTLKKLSLETDISYKNIKNIYDNYIQNKTIEKKQEEIKIEKTTLKQYELAEYHLIYYMLDNIKVIKEVESKVAYFPDDLIRFLYNEIEYYYNKYKEISLSSFINYINDKPDLLNKLNEIISYIKKDEYTEEEINDYITVVNKYLKKEKINNLEKEFHSEFDPIKKAEILKKIMEVKGVKS